MDWYKIDTNPEPWAIGPLGTGRRGGKIWAYVGRNNQLHSYQEAVKEELEGSPMYDGDLHLLFLFWRHVERSQHENYADVTNLQKGTEDALQGVLFDNDRVVLHTESILMAQGPMVEGKVLIGIEPYSEKALPIAARDLLERSTTSSSREPSDNSHDSSPEDVF